MSENTSMKNGLVESEVAKHRIRIFEEIREREDDRIQSLSGDIKVTLLVDGEEIEATVPRGKASPYQVSEKLKNGIAKAAVIAKVNNVLFDLHRPLEEDCRLELLSFDSKEGKHVFWHSSAHALGESLEIAYGAKLTIGPALEDSFYYDADIGEKTINQDDYKEIEEKLRKVAGANQRFERIALTKQEALDMFKHNNYKIQLIHENIADDAVCTAYRCGPLIDLCRGPHLPSTGYIKAFKIIKHSSCYWKGDSANVQLQRVYGIAFPNKKLLKDRLKEIELCKLRDHRKIGKDQNLFFFHHYSPGSAFWMPNGTKIYNKLVDLIKSEYRQRGYREVITPNVYNIELWNTSGHAAKYKKNMFTFQIENQEFAMKPMNCPGHCLMFKHQSVSYRDLPIRFADFGVLHRNELTGALSGLSRVRRFQQDDAHIFCDMESIGSELLDTLQFMSDIYRIFEFQFTLVLSTRPKDFIGQVEIWDRAEATLKKSLDEFGSPWSVNEGDGAFYGPKIDVLLHDALGRSTQCATVQLDFNLPSSERFDLTFTNKEGAPEHPVIIHRAILGSVERFVALITENCGGKWPFWISPRQVILIPVSEKFSDFGKEIAEKLWNKGLEAEVDMSNNKLNKKIREAEIAQINVIVVVGQKEVDSGVFPIRFRDKKEFEEKTLNELIELLEELRKTKTCKY